MDSLGNKVLGCIINNNTITQCNLSSLMQQNFLSSFEKFRTLSRAVLLHSVTQGSMLLLLCSSSMSMEFPKLASKNETARDLSRNFLLTELRSVPFTISYSPLAKACDTAPLNSRDWKVPRNENRAGMSEH